MYFARVGESFDAVGFSHCKWSCVRECAAFHTLEFDGILIITGALGQVVCLFWRVIGYLIRIEGGFQLLGSISRDLNRGTFSILLIFFEIFRTNVPNSDKCKGVFKKVGC